MTSSRRITRHIAAICCACSLAAIASATASAETITLTFEHIDDTGDLYPPSYTESGFIVTSLASDGGHLHWGGETLWLHSREGSSPYHLARLDGGAFDFLAFDYSGGDSVFVSDTGATFTILGDQPLATFSMPAGFENVHYIDWYMTNPGDLDSPQEQWGSLDNVVMNVSPVPEPAQAAMLALGLAGLLLRARGARRR